MINASYIMTYRETGADRERNMLIILEWLSKYFPNFEIVLVESDVERKIERKIKNQGVKLIFHESDKIFNRGKTRNIGALNASTDVLIFADNDVITNPDVFRESVEACCEKIQAVKWFSKCIDLSEENLLQMNLGQNGLLPLFSPPDFPGSEDLEGRVDLNFAGGGLIIRKKDFFYLGGWPEELIGWGGEDDIFSYIIDRFLQTKIFKNFIYHLPHTRSTFDWYDHPEFKNNCKKMNMVLSFSDDELINYCNKQRKNLLASPFNQLSTLEMQEIQDYDLPKPPNASIIPKTIQKNGELPSYSMIEE